MSIARVLVPADGTARDRIALVQAIAAARPFAAHVEMLAVHPAPAESVPNVGVLFSTDAVQAMVEGQRSYTRGVDGRIRQTLEGVCAEHDVTVVPKPERASGVTCSLSIAEGDFERVASARAALSDLVVFPPVAGAEAPLLSAVFQHVLREVRRPVLVATVDPPAALRRIVVGWDGSRTAARAIRAAIPFLETADEVTVISVLRPGQPEPAAAALSNFLARHQVRFACRRLMPEGVAPARALMDAASDADLVVAGGYGHGVFQEALLGGVTAALLAAPAVPLLLAH